MSETIVLDAQLRDNEKTSAQLRKEGFLTGTVYGKGMDSVSVTVSNKAFSTAYDKNKDAVMKLKVNKKSYEVKVRDVQMNYATGEKLNVQFQNVKQ